MHRSAYGGWMGGWAERSSVGSESICHARRPTWPVVPAEPDFLLVNIVGSRASVPRKFTPLTMTERLRWVENCVMVAHAEALRRPFDGLRDWPAQQPASSPLRGGRTRLHWAPSTTY